MKIRIAYRILTVLFMSFCSCFLSTGGEVQAGSIEGKVFDSSSTPVPIGNLAVGAYLEDDDKNLVKYAATDGTGQYTLDELSEGIYKIVFFTYSTDYIEEWYNSVSDAYSFADAEPISVAGDPVSLSDTFLEKGAKITGTVTAEGSNGATKIAGISAIAYDTDGNWVTASGETGSDGIYSLGGLRAGDYKVQFRASGTDYAAEWHQDKHTFNPADTVTISDLNNEITINAELGPGGSISGQVTDSKGVGIVGALVKVYDSSSDATDSPIEFATTVDNGLYTVTGLPASGVSFKVQFFQQEGDGSGSGLTEWYDNVSDFANAAIVSSGAAGVDAVLEQNFNWLIFTPALTHRPTP